MIKIVYILILIRVFIGILNINIFTISYSKFYFIILLYLNLCSNTIIIETKT